MKIFLSVIICFLSVYGAFKAIYEITRLFVNKNNFKPKFSYRIIGIDDTTKDLDVYLRIQDLKEEKEGVILIDYAEDEEIKKICRLSEKDFDFVKSMTPAEYKEYINTY